ncbi:N-glycosylase/DNA lyase [Candidatus Pacearchaeota archaeon]|nr:N-glycosylase/DNA lyase [Candidatus Pacearchaeota archaeon]
MDKIISLVNNLKNSPIKSRVDSRMNEFSELGKKSSNEIFKELCFCLMTANFSALGGIKIQNEINDGFLHLRKEELAQKLSELGHRFPNARAQFIFEAQKYKNNIKEMLNSLNSDEEKRNWLVKNIKGLGMKEASHFLRNIGFKNLAIIDFHIIDILVKNSLIEKPKNKSLTTKKYLEIENILKKIADEVKLSLGELDLYLWYEETGKILK